MQAVWMGSFPYQMDGTQRTLRFKPAPIEVTLEVAVTGTGKAEAGVKWWVIDAGAKVSREKVATQTVKLTLEPVMFDAAGRQVEVLVDTADDAAKPGDGDDRHADAPD